MAVDGERREGSLDAPTRHPLNWKEAEFYNEESLFKELERVYDICHGCRRCVSLCNSFPTLFDLIDNSESMEIDGVDKKDYWQVVDHCYLCDLCYLTKCPYVPPHEWNLDFPHVMLRAKAVKFKKGEADLNHKILSSTDAVGTLAGIPVVSQLVNAANENSVMRKGLEAVLGVHHNAAVPKYHSDTLRRREKGRDSQVTEVAPAGRTTGRVALFATCYGNYNDPQMGQDLISVFEHNGIAVTLAEKERCCGMPKLELGDLEAVEQAKEANIPTLVKMIDQGWDIVAPIPSCVLMFKQELPLMFPDDPDVQRVKEHIFDPFEYLAMRHKADKLKTDFPNRLGKVAYHVACHQRVQQIGPKTRDMLALVPETEIELIERCSGHDGTYAVRKQFHEVATKICRPVVRRVESFQPDYYTSDCIMAGHHIGNGMEGDMAPKHPITLLRIAYGI